MTERELIALVTASLAASPAYAARVLDASSPADWRRVVQDATDLVRAVDEQVKWQCVGSGTIMNDAPLGAKEGSCPVCQQDVPFVSYGGVRVVAEHKVKRHR